MITTERIPRMCLLNAPRDPHFVNAGILSWSVIKKNVRLIKSFWVNWTRMEMALINQMRIKSSLSNLVGLRKYPTTAYSMPTLLQWKKLHCHQAADREYMAPLYTGRHAPAMQHYGTTTSSFEIEWGKCPLATSTTITNSSTQHSILAYQQSTHTHILTLQQFVIKAFPFPWQCDGSVAYCTVLCLCVCIVCMLAMCTHT